jgi:hypothetical protein
MIGNLPTHNLDLPTNDTECNSVVALKSDASDLVIAFQNDTIWFQLIYGNYTSNSPQSSCQDVSTYCVIDNTLLHCPSIVINPLCFLLFITLVCVNNSVTN